MATEDFHIISSLRYDPALPGVVAQSPTDSNFDPLQTPYYLLPYHQDRLRNAARHFNWKDALKSLEQDQAQFTHLLDTFLPSNTKPWRLRILMDRTGKYTVEATPAASMNLQNLLLPSHSLPRSNPWYIYIDTTPTVPSAFTTHKTTVRGNYTAARLRVGITSPQDPAEVLVVNPGGEVMEGSITTPYFRRRGRAECDQPGQQGGSEWVTPPLSSGGNAGTTRQYAIDRGFCTEQAVKAADLVDGEECLLSNSVRGFIYGKIVLGSSETPPYWTIGS